MKKNSMWDDKAKEYMLLYIQSNNKEDKDKYYNILYPYIHNMIYIELKKIKFYDKSKFIEDYLQDIHTHIYVKVLPKITEHTAITALRYIYLSISNYIKTYLYRYNKYEDKHIIYMPISNIDELKDSSNLYNETDSMDLYNEYDYKIDIIDRMNTLIKQERYVNRRNTLFLIELKDYIIENDFDVSEFKEYIMNKLDINNNTFYYIASKLNIRTSMFNDKMFDCSDLQGGSG